MFELIMVVIWGYEINYGSYIGNFDLFCLFVSFVYEGCRWLLFVGEFIVGLKMFDCGVICE